MNATEALERRIDELCEQVEYDRQTSRSRLERIDQLEAENAKLRELVRDMFYAVHPADREKFLTNVAELGVEVDG